jgi:hypothetical protein
MDEELVRRMVVDMVSECFSDLDFKMIFLQDKIASLEGKLSSLEATAGGAAATKEPTSEFRGRMASLEVAAAASPEGLEELRANAPAAGYQTPATCYDIRQLEEKMGALASEVGFARRELQKFGDFEAAQKALEAAQTALKAEQKALHKEVGAMEDEIDHSRVRSAVFTLSAIGLKNGDRKMCMDRLKTEEERLRQGTIGATPGVVLAVDAVEGGRNLEPPRRDARRRPVGPTASTARGPTASTATASCSSDGSSDSAVSAPSKERGSRLRSFWMRSTSSI